MQESRRLSSRIPRNVSNLMDDEVRVCDICGDVGFDYLLVVCHKCHEGAEHTYCMRVKLQEIPKQPGWTWTCEECMPREETNQLVQDEVEEVDSRKKRPLYESSANHESSKGSRLKRRYSCVRGIGRNVGSSSAHLPAKRHKVPSEAQDMAIETDVVFLKSNKPCNNPLLRKDFPNKKVKTEKMRSVNQIVYSGPQRGSDSQEKEKVPYASDVGEPVTISTELNEKGKALGGSVISPRTSNPDNLALVCWEPPSKKLGKVKLDNVPSVSTLKKSSKGTLDKEKLPNSLDDESPKLASQTEIAHDKCSQLALRSSKAASLKSKGQLEKASCSEKSNASSSEILLIDANEFYNSAKKIISGGETLLLGPRFCNTDAVESSGQLDRGLPASTDNAEKDSNCPNEKEKNESQQGEQPTKAATDISIDKLCTDPTSDERTDLRDLIQVEAAPLSPRPVMPEADHTWLGRFVIHNSEGNRRTWDRIRAHLSTCASLEVLEEVGRLPEIVVLEELPRLKIWPSQFMETQVTEENIALYFSPQDLDSCEYYPQFMNHMIENDLALRGNLDGVELLIFPSNVLPMKSHIWNHMFFFWGMFKAKEVINSANTPVSNSLHLENNDAAKLLAFDLNAYPEDKDGEGGVDVTEIPKSGDIGDERDKMLVVVQSSNSKEENAEEDNATVNMNMNLSIWDDNDIPENALLGIEYNNVEMPSTSLSLAPPHATYEENLDPDEVQVAEFLEFLSKKYE